jgi:predicted HTH domain antitoxin
METIAVTIPKELIHIFKIREKDLSKAVRESLAIELYREGKISMGKAAEIAKLSRWEMFELLGRKEIPLQYYPEDFKQDIETLEKMLK